MSSTDDRLRTSSAAHNLTESPVDPLLLDRESAALLRVGLSTFRRYVANGLVPKPIKLGGTARWPRSEILGVIATAKAQRDAN